MTTRITGAGGLARWSWTRYMPSVYCPVPLAHDIRAPEKVVPLDNGVDVVHRTIRTTWLPKHPLVMAPISFMLSQLRRKAIHTNRMLVGAVHRQ